MKNVYIHIGTPKTGTSYIQRILYYNAAELKAQDFCYYTQGATNNRKLLQQLKTAPDPRAKASQFLAYLDAASASNIIISDEALSLVPCNWLRHVKTDKYQFHVACYVRSPASYAESAYKQWGFKLTDHSDFFNYLEHWQHPSWLNKLKHWKQLGANISIFPYMPRSTNILDQFRKFLAVDFKFAASIEKNDIWGSNPSFSALGMELARRLHQRSKKNNPQIQLFLQKFGVKECFSKQKNAFIFMRPEQVATYNEQNKERVTELEPLFGGPLFDMLASYDQQSPFEAQSQLLNEEFLLDVLFKVMDNH